MDEELCVLMSIYFDELLITYTNDNNKNRAKSIKITIYSNGDENDIDNEKRLLCVTFNSELSSNYPNESPLISLSQPRGLTDQQIDILYKTIETCLKNNQNSCVLYECIELVRDQLCKFEIPSENCAICLSSMNNRLKIIRTNCYHYYHLKCLAFYVKCKKLELKKQYEESKKMDFI